MNVKRQAFYPGSGNIIIAQQMKPVDPATKRWRTSVTVRDNGIKDSSNALVNAIATVNERI